MVEIWTRWLKAVTHLITLSDASRTAGGTMAVVLNRVFGLQRQDWVAGLPLNETVASIHEAVKLEVDNICALTIEALAL